MRGIKSGRTFGILEDLAELLATVADFADTDTCSGKVKKRPLSLLER